MTDRRYIISDEILVGLSKKNNSHAPGAWMTTAGSDSAAQGRMRTVKSNSNETWLIPNTPVTGISIGGHSWKDEIRVEDPRGFSVNLRVPDLLDVMQDCVVINNTLQTPCVWARSLGNLTLVAVGSETHTLALNQTRLANSKVSVKDVKLGSWITLNNGEQGYYMGKYYVMHFDMSTWTGHSNPNKLVVDHTARMVLWKPDTKHIWNPQKTQSLVVTTSAVIAEHELKEYEFTPEQAELKVNQLIQDPSCTRSNNSRDLYSENVVLLSRKHINYPDIQIVPHKLNISNVGQLEDVVGSVHYHDGNSFWMRTNMNSQKNSMTLHKWHDVHLANHELRWVVVTTGINRGRVETQHVDPQQVLNDLYVLTLEYKTALGNQLVHTL